jgi:threonine synthase
MIESVFELAENEGVYSEPAAAASIAALKKLVKNGTIDESDNAVCMMTGHGLKDPSSTMKTIDVPVIDPDLEALKDVM